MPEITLFINDDAVAVREGTTISAAVALAGENSFRKSVNGEPRGPLCGMGICFECRVTIDGEPHQRSCQLICREGMKVRTNG
jgi:predicted molibdopterin-dependent oxidoreductase YjgC